MVTVPPPRGLGRDTSRRAEARQHLVETLWNPDGTRRLPSDRALAATLTACDRRDVWWVCETASAGPVYFLPTTTWVGHLARWLRAQGARRVLEVGAGDGFLARCLQAAAPDLEVTATDDGSWSRPARRMNAADRELFRDVPVAGIPVGPGVRREKAAAAVARYRPDVTLVAWPPPGLMVERVIRAPSWLVLEISVDGDVCGNSGRTWRFHKDFLEGALESKALCRLDARPEEGRATRVTLYPGARHPDHGLDEGYG
jgi:hypothetical protein